MFNRVHVLFSEITRFAATACVEPLAAWIFVRVWNTPLA